MPADYKNKICLVNNSLLVYVVKFCTYFYNYVNMQKVRNTGPCMTSR